MENSDGGSHYRGPLRNISVYVGMDKVLRKIFLGMLSNKFGTLGEVRDLGDGTELKTYCLLFSEQMAVHDHIFTDLSLEVVKDVIGLCEHDGNNNVVCYELGRSSFKKI